MPKINWIRVIIGVIIGVLILSFAVGIAYWAYIYLPQKENEAIMKYLDMVERQWMLQKAALQFEQTQE